MQDEHPLKEALARGRPFSNGWTDAIRRLFDRWPFDRHVYVIPVLLFVIAQVEPSPAKHLEVSF